MLVYFIPKVSAVNLDTLQKRGLDYIIPVIKREPAQVATSSGPDGSSGVIFTYTDEGLKLDGIKWTDLKSNGVWIGYNPQSNKIEKQLKRETQLGGHQTLLSNGELWNVPVLRLLGSDDDTPLPRKLEYDGEKWIEGNVKDEYQELFEKSCKMWDDFITGGKSDITLSDGWDVAGDALCLNYRLSKMEISIMGLFDSQSASKSALAVIDYPAWDEYVKKKLNTTQSNIPSLPDGDKD